jgi:hypothetical protein
MITTQEPTLTGRGPREGYFIYAPSITANTFQHLSIRGNRYRLRNFHATGPHVRARGRIIDGYPTIDELRASHLISRWIPVTQDDLRQNVILKPSYWHARIQQINAQELAQQSNPAAEKQRP